MNVRTLVLSIVLSVVWTGSSLAEDRGSQSDQDACTPDVFRLCQDFIPNEDPIVACLKSKRDELSPACHHVFFPDPPPPSADDKTDATTNDGSKDEQPVETQNVHKPAHDPADDGDPPPPTHHKHRKMHHHGDGQPKARTHHHHRSDQN